MKKAGGLLAILGGTVGAYSALYALYTAHVVNVLQSSGLARMAGQSWVSTDNTMTEGWWGLGLSILAVAAGKAQISTETQFDLHSRCIFGFLIVIGIIGFTQCDTTVSCTMILPLTGGLLGLCARKPKAEVAAMALPTAVTVSADMITPEPSVITQKALAVQRKGFSQSFKWIMAGIGAFVILLIIVAAVSAEMKKTLSASSSSQIPPSASAAISAPAPAPAEDNTDLLADLPSCDDLSMTMKIIGHTFEVGDIKFTVLSMEHLGHRDEAPNHRRVCDVNLTTTVLGEQPFHYFITSEAEGQYHHATIELKGGLYIPEPVASASPSPALDQTAAQALQTTETTVPLVTPPAATPMNIPAVASASAPAVALDTKNPSTPPDATRSSGAVTMLPTYTPDTDVPKLTDNQQRMLDQYAATWPDSKVQETMASIKAGAPACHNQFDLRFAAYITLQMETIETNTLGIDPRPTEADLEKALTASQGIASGANSLIHVQGCIDTAQSFEKLQAQSIVSAIQTRISQGDFAPASTAAQPSEAESRVTGTPPSPDAKPQASFDCNQAHSVLEILICGDSQLASMDLQTAQAYEQRRDSLPDGSPEKTAFLHGQREFLKSRVRSCPIPMGNISDAESKALIACLQAQYIARLEFLRSQ